MDSQLGELEEKNVRIPNTPQKIDFGANQVLLIAATKNYLK